MILDHQSYVHYFIISSKEMKKLKNSGFIGIWTHDVTAEVFYQQWTTRIKPNWVVVSLYAVKWNLTDLIIIYTWKN